MTPYLLFGLHGARYGVDARLVGEIFRLPELTQAEEAPHYIAGLVNLRGKIETVMNLDLRFGHAPRRYQLTDSIILLKMDNLSMGIIVSEVHDVMEISADAIEPIPLYGIEARSPISFLAGEAKVGDAIIMLLNEYNLVNSPSVSATSAQDTVLPTFCPEATPAEREIFQSRAMNLIQKLESHDTAGQTPLAVVKLGGEYFGVELNVVREFAHLHHVTPIPCCPAHIAGNMNLRGDILTLVDIQHVLKIPQQAFAASVMVAQADDLRVGVPVAEVYDVIYLHTADITPAPASSGKLNDEYCKGVVRYGDKMVSVLDLYRILTKGGLEVEEEA